jgi:hypothetical protein
MPVVETAYSMYDYCTLAGERLEDGPANFDDYLGVSGAMYTDETFNDKGTLYWTGHSNNQDTWDAWFDYDWNEF